MVHYAPHTATLTGFRYTRTTQQHSCDVLAMFDFNMKKKKNKNKKKKNKNKKNKNINNCYYYYFDSTSL